MLLGVIVFIGQWDQIEPIVITTMLTPDINRSNINEFIGDHVRELMNQFYGQGQVKIEDDRFKRKNTQELYFVNSHSHVCIAKLYSDLEQP